MLVVSHSDQDELNETEFNSQNLQAVRFCALPTFIADTLSKLHQYMLQEGISAVAKFQLKVQNCMFVVDVRYVLFTPENIDFALVSTLSWNAFTNTLEILDTILPNVFLSKKFINELYIWYKTHVLAVNCPTLKLDILSTIRLFLLNTLQEDTNLRSCIPL